jgi:Uma2 family endonuclease
MATTVRPATEDDLRRTPDDGNKYELVDGAIVMSPAGARHGSVALKLGARLLAYVTASRLGHVFDSSTGFRLPGGNVRVPDVAFVATGRFADEKLTDDFADFAPDLAVEVLSPSDRNRQVLDRVGDYLDAGTRLVWVVDPRRRQAAVYRSLSDVRHLNSTDTLDGEDVLPGFRCVLEDILD